MSFSAYSGILLLAIVAGCATPSNRPGAGQSPSPIETEAIRQRAGMEPVQVRQAISIYNLKCARCHQFYDPASYETGEWNHWMAKMSRKARLTDDQNQLLSRYLNAFRLIHDPSQTSKPAAAP